MRRPTAAASGDWEKLYSDKYKRDYWKNKTTGETTWKEPKATAAAAPAAAAAESSVSTGEWGKVYSEEYKRDYWFDKSTHQTTWTDPTSSTAIATAAAASAADGEVAQSSIRMLAHIKTGADASVWVRCIVELRGTGSKCAINVYNIALIEDESMPESNADIQITVDKLMAIICNGDVGELVLQRRGAEVGGEARLGRARPGRGSLSLKNANDLMVYTLRYPTYDIRSTLT